MTLNNGGAVSSVNGFIGDLLSGAGQGFVDGAGSNWTMSGELRVGNAGEGELTISNGGSVDVALDAVLGRNSGSMGTLAFGIGDDGTGTLASGLLNVAGELGIGNGTSAFDLQVDNGIALSLGDAFTLVDYGTLESGFAFDSLNDDDIFTAGPYDFRIDFNADLDGQGDLGIVATVVPEPSSLALVVFSVAGVFFRIRR